MKLAKILNELQRSSRYGTVNISAYDLINHMDKIEEMGIDVEREDGLSADGKTYLEFTVYPEGREEENLDQAFTVYDFKFGEDPTSEENFRTEYPFSLGARKRIGLVNASNLGLEIASLSESSGSKMNEVSGALYVQKAVQDEIAYHIDTYRKGVINVDDMIQAIEEILYGKVVAPGQRSEASGEIGVDQQGDTTRDINITNDTSMYDPLKEDLKDLASKSGMKLSDLMAKIKSIKDKEKDQAEKDAFKQSALAEDRSPEELLRKIEKDLRGRFGDRYSDMEIQLFIDSLGRDLKRGDFDGVETMYGNEDHYEDFEEYIVDKRSNLEEVDEGVEFFRKISGVTPLKGIGNGGLM